MLEAGGLALKTFRGRPRSWIKGKSSPVSEADLAVDALLRERLLGDPPGGLAIGGNGRRSGTLKSAEVWVVDPIDGTRAYLAGSPEWTISVALVRGGRPLLGALYAR